jgi:hypothetical protein
MPDALAPDSSHASAAPLFAGAALLDAEKLDVYRIALEFEAIAGPLVTISFQLLKCCADQGQAPGCNTSRSVPFSRAIPFGTYNVGHERGRVGTAECFMRVGGVGSSFRCPLHTRHGRATVEPRRAG